MGVGLWLYNLLDDGQKRDLQLALADEVNQDEATQPVVRLLHEAQQLEKDAADLSEAMEDHQAVYDYVSACAEPDEFDHDENQLEQLAELICSLHCEAASKDKYTWILSLRTCMVC